MDIAYEKEYHQLEENNWWFVARRHMVYYLFNKCKIDKNKSILEIGCSGGPLMKKLEKDGYKNIYGIDISTKAIELAQMRGVKNVAVMDGTNPTFEPQSFDLIIASDVLEHIEDASNALKNWYNILKPGGKIIVFVPAFNFLWSSHDIVNHHFSRYSEKELINILKQANFYINRSSYWNVMLFFPTFFVRMWQRVTNKPSAMHEKKGQLVKLPDAVNQLLIKWLKIENRYLKHLKSIIGVSVFAIAERK